MTATNVRLGQLTKTLMISYEKTETSPSRCAYNSLMAIPLGHLQNGNALHQEWANEFQKLIDTTQFGYETICNDEAQVSTYSQSTVVLGDYGKYASSLHCDFKYKESAKFAVARGWEITGDQTGNNWRYVWFETGWRDTNDSSGTDNAYPTVGSKKLQWNYRGGTWRRAEWYFKDKLILMRDSDYPFAGLKD